MQHNVGKNLVLILFFLISFRLSAEEYLENLASPVTTDAKYYLLTGSALTATLFIFKNQIVDPLQKYSANKKPLGKFSQVGNLAGQGIPNAIYILGQLGYGLENSDSLAKQNASGMFQASLYAIAVSTAMKYAVQEKRPDTETRDSFPSGHTTAAFAFASYVGCRHSVPWGVGAYSLATLVGYSRINDNRHHLQDVVAGATIGGGFGLGVCLAENSRKTAQENVQFSALPLPGGGEVRFALNF